MAGVCFSPRKRKNCKVNCCVVNCNSSAQKNPNIRFYQFPKENASPVMVWNSFGVLEQSNKLQCYIKALRIGKKVTSSMRLCSLHFKLLLFHLFWTWMTHFLLMRPVCIAPTIYCDLSSKSTSYQCKIIYLSYPLQIYELMQNFLLINQIRNMKLNVKI